MFRLNFSDEEDEEMMGEYMNLVRDKEETKFQLEIDLNNDVSIKPNLNLLIGVGLVGENFIDHIKEVQLVGYLKVNDKKVCSILEICDGLYGLSIPYQPVLELTYSIVELIYGYFKPKQIKVIDSYNVNDNNEDYSLLQLSNTGKPFEGINLNYFDDFRMIEGLSSSIITQSLLNETYTPVLIILIPTLAPYDMIKSFKYCKNFIMKSKHVSEDIDDYVEDINIKNEIIQIMNNSMKLDLKLQFNSLNLNKDLKRFINKPTYKQNDNDDNLMYI